MTTTATTSGVDALDTAQPAPASDVADPLVFPSRPTEPRPIRWTRAQYYALFEAGYFEGKRVQLWDGEIIEMPSQGNWHVVTVGKVMNALSLVFPHDQFWIRLGNPLELPNDSEPEPDVVVVRGTPDDYITHPTTALLAVEVAASSLSFDRKKANGYAAAGVQDYWLVNLAKHQVEVYRRPMADPQEPLGHKYQSTEALDPGATIVPVAAPQARINVADLLPKQRVTNLIG